MACSVRRMDPKTQGPKATSSYASCWRTARFAVRGIRPSWRRYEVAMLSAAQVLEARSRADDLDIFTNPEIIRIPGYAG